MKRSRIDIVMHALISVGVIAASVLHAAVQSPALTHRVPATLRAEAKGPVGTTNSLAQPIRLPGSASWFVDWPADDWVNADTLEFEIAWPANAPTNAQVLVHVSDWDYLWYQHLAPGYLVAGTTNRFRVDVSADARGWTTHGHKATWHHRVLLRPKEVGIRIFGGRQYAGDVELANATVAFPSQPEAAPVIRYVRASADRVNCYARFQLTFALPDRYPDPYDRDAVAVTARFEGPDGETTDIDGYYGRDYYRTVDEQAETIVPQGPPYWRVRFTPRLPGTYRYTLSVQDAYGESEWGPATLQVAPAESHGFIRVAKQDPRYFEHDDGTFFYPIGHNVRSPFDTRMDKEFPWAERRVYGTDRYNHYFRNMANHGENLAEVWMASWSLGLEWLAKWDGYHGIGQYSMRNAWELDQVIDTATRHGIHINLVIHNHGKYSTFSDAEWAFNPFSVANGGYLEKPADFFTDAGAMEDYRKLVRYIIARWGYSPHIFSWELWSELDLTGSSHGERLWMTQPVVDWHQLMGRTIKDMDPYDHMVSTHVCGDYTHQNPAIVSLPEIDLCPVDAYHGSDDPLHIVTLLRGTAANNRSYGKPVLPTEFGGSPHGQNVANLEASLHAAIWAATSLDIGGTPLFWWWELIEEENYYPKYAALKAFMEGVDKRDPDLQATQLRLNIDGVVTTTAAGECLAGPSQAIGWIYRKAQFSNDRAEGREPIRGVEATVVNLDDAAYLVEFWNTELGRPLNSVTVQAENGSVRLNVPAFDRDIAFKLNRR